MGDGSDGTSRCTAIQAGIVNSGTTCSYTKTGYDCESSTCQSGTWTASSVSCLTRAPTAAPTATPSKPSYNSGYSSGGGDTSGSKAPTRAPTATPTAPDGTKPIKISQVLTINVANFSVADWKGDMKLTYETGYGIKLGIYNVARRAAGWKQGCAVTSTVAAARRGKFKITFIATVSAKEAVAAQASAQTMTTASLIAAVQQAAVTLKASGEITTDPKIFTPAEMEGLSIPTVAVAPTAAPTMAPVATASSSGDGSAVIIIVVVCVIVCVIAGVGGAFYYLHNKPQQESTVAVKGANIGVELDVAASNAPPPGAVYMKNGQWLDKNDKPVGQQPEQQI